MSDSVQRLAHDHGEINHQVLAAGALLRKLKADDHVRAAFVTAIAQLRELLFLHFAREEEGVFPFVAETFPALADRARELATAHDTICGSLVRTYHQAASGGDVAAVVATFERFEHAYASHAQVEAALLNDLANRLDAGQRAALSALIEGL